MSLTFEDNIDFIDTEINKRRNLWQLSSVQWMDFDDVAQIIRIHVCEKWSSYDSSRPLGPWLNRVISHKIKNIIRDVWGNRVRPCIAGPGCAAAEGENLCKIYGTQCSDCPLYAAWEKSRKRAYDLEFALPLDNFLNDQEIGYDDEQNIDTVAKVIHAKMEKLLKPIEWTIYKYLFIEHLSEEEVAKKMGYKTTEVGRRAGYKQIRNIRKAIMDKVKRALREDEIDII